MSEGVTRIALTDRLERCLMSSVSGSRPGAKALRFGDERKRCADSAARVRTPEVTRRQVRLLTLTPPDDPLTVTRGATARLRVLSGRQPRKRRWTWPNIATCGRSKTSSGPTTASSPSATHAMRTPSSCVQSRIIGGCGITAARGRGTATASMVGDTPVKIRLFHPVTRCGHRVFAKAHSSLPGIRHG
jgi:hypothetical protein